MAAVLHCPNLLLNFVPHTQFFVTIRANHHIVLPCVSCKSFRGRTWWLICVDWGALLRSWTRWVEVHVQVNREINTPICIVANKKGVLLWWWAKNTRWPRKLSPKCQPPWKRTTRKPWMPAKPLPKMRTSKSCICFKRRRQRRLRRWVQRWV